MIETIEYIEILNNPDKIKDLNIEEIKYIAEKLNINILNNINDDKYKNVMTEDIVVKILDMDEVDYINKFVRLNKISDESLIELVGYLADFYYDNGIEYFIDTGYDELFIQIIEEVDHSRFRKTIDYYADGKHSVLFDMMEILEELMGADRLVVRDKFFHNYIDNYGYLSDIEFSFYDKHVGSSIDPFIINPYSSYSDHHHWKDKRRYSLNDALKDISDGENIKSITFKKGNRNFNTNHKGVDISYAYRY